MGSSYANRSCESVIDEILLQLKNEEFDGKVLTIQTSLFKKEMNTSEIMQLPISEREAYFQELENLKLESFLRKDLKYR